MLRNHVYSWIYWVTDYKISNNQMFKRLATVCAVIFGLMFMILIAYSINISTFSNPESWKQAVLDKCHIKNGKLADNKLFARAVFTKTFGYIGCFGGIFGSILYARYSHTHVDSLDFLPFWKTLARLAINMVL